MVTSRSGIESCTRVVTFYSYPVFQIRPAREVGHTSNHNGDKKKTFEILDLCDHFLVPAGHPRRQRLLPSSLWAEPAPTPESTPITGHSPSAICDRTPAPTILWAPQAPAPSHPAILGHKYNDPQPLDLTFPLSPIPVTSPNLNPFMNEIYSYSQMYDPDDTLLAITKTY